MSFGLSSKIITQINSVFKKYPDIAKVKIYGSRAMNTYRRGSDIDLAIFSESGRDLSSKLSWELDDLPNLYLFDLVNYNTLERNPLKEDIDKYGKIFYQKKSKTSSSENPEKSITKKQIILISDKAPDRKNITKLKIKKQSISKKLNTEETKQTEIGKIPKDWGVFTVEHLFNLKQGKSLSSKNQTGLYLKPFLRTSNVLWGHLDFSKLDEMDIPNKERESLLLKKGDLLVCEGGDIGRTAIWNEELKECYYQNHIHRLRAKTEDIYPLFYMYWMNSAIRISGIYGTFGNHTTIPNLSGKRLVKFQVPCPSLSEQKKIAGVLSQVQKAIEAQDKLIKATEELKQSTMKQLFTYGIRNKKTKQTEIGQIPKDWGVFKIEHIFDLKQGKSLSSKNQTGLYLKPFLRTSNVLWGCLDFKKIDKMDILDKEKKALLLKKGDLLICEGGDIGRTAIWNKELKECYYQNHIHRLRSKKENIYPLFYMYWMDIAIRILNVYGTFGNRTTIPNLPGKRLIKFKIPYPSLLEQKEIADILTKIDQKIQTHKKKKENLNNLFKSMLSKLMTGKIRVHKLDLEFQDEINF